MKRTFLPHPLPSHHTSQVITVAENHVNRLLREQYQLVLWALERVPAELRELCAWYDARTHVEVYECRQRLIDGVIAYAGHKAESGRVFCPLCSEGASARGGFEVPVGLQRHLTGHGNAQECIVLAGLEAMMRYAVNRRLGRSVFAPFVD